MTQYTIQSVAEYVQLIMNLSQTTSLQLFYRGHYKTSFKLLPCIYRDNYIHSEKEIIEDALRHFPNEFRNLSLIEQLIKMQHFGLPTRLLDVTSSPLVALYFACYAKEESICGSEDGEVIVFAFKNGYDGNIYDTNSDTATLLAHLSLQAPNFQVNCGGKKVLLHSIQHDKPQYKLLFEKEDLQKTILLMAAQNNMRIVSQQGAFILFGMGNQKKEPVSIPKDVIKHRILIDGCCKRNIIQELKNLRICTSTLFPDMENTFREITHIYDKSNN